MLNIALCDDIAEYRESLKAMIKYYFDGLESNYKVFEFASGEELLRCRRQLDILFLDIELGDTNGISVAKKIQKKSPNTVILIVTSYNQYLDEAMDINVARYISKPIDPERVFSALDKAREIIDDEILTLHGETGRVLKLKKHDIVYAEAKMKKVTLFTLKGEYKINEPIKEMKDLLSASYFAVPHNSYIVNLNYVFDFHREKIKLEYKDREIAIAIATRKKAEFRKRFFDFTKQ